MLIATSLYNSCTLALGSNDYSLNSSAAAADSCSSPMLATAATDAAARVWDLRYTTQPFLTNYHDAEVRGNRENFGENCQLIEFLTNYHDAEIRENMENFGENYQLIEFLTSYHDAEVRGNRENFGENCQYIEFLINYHDAEVRGNRKNYQHIAFLTNYDDAEVRGNRENYQHNAFLPIITTQRSGEPRNTTHCVPHQLLRCRGQENRENCNTFRSFPITTSQRSGLETENNYQEKSKRKSLISYISACDYATCT